MKKIITLIISCSLFVSCKGQIKSEIVTLDVKSYAEKLKQTEIPQLIDVRTPEEFASEKIDNASNINFLSPEFVSKCEQLDPTKPVFVYCKVGGRSAKAAEKLTKMGFKTIYNLEGGIMKWNANKPEKTYKKIIGICPQEYQEMIKTDPKIMVSFYAKWCEPCHIMQPYIIKMETEMQDKVKIIRLDADQNKTILEELKIDGLPVILIYENGKETFRKIGFMSEEELKKQL